MLRFFHNHGFLGLKTQHPWWTVTHGAREYVDRLVRPFADRIRQACPAIAIRRELGGAVVTAKDGQSVFFDKVILAAHANESLILLKDADSQEEQVLGKFHYRSNLITIHSDETLMPRTKMAWASWNYRMGEDSQGNPLPQTLYWMNRLQNLDCRQNYFVSVNGSSEINPETVHRRIEYTHPQFTVEAVRAQAQLPLLNRRSPNQAVYFAGSYFRYGFHEDAYGSAVDLAGVLLGKPIYPGLGWL
ncbi:MAG: hypothetical protein EXS25_11875 [Pedosphaera sp.]|nr:hypothetical protein [Pedosphaera sp.]